MGERKSRLSREVFLGLAVWLLGSIVLSGLLYLPLREAGLAEQIIFYGLAGFCWGFICEAILPQLWRKLRE